jgi:hypothetical protein
MNEELVDTTKDKAPYTMEGWLSHYRRQLHSMVCHHTNNIEGAKNIIEETKKLCSELSWRLKDAEAVLVSAPGS